MKTIILKFAGTLQSWGTGSSFETRHTDFHPSKSGVIGMIAASMGYRRDEDEKIQKLNEIDFAVRIDQQGNLVKDYHIAKKYKPNGDFERTYVTNRYYLEDAVFLVAISHENHEFIKSILNAIKKPYFQSYFGRRSLAPNYDFILDFIDQDPIKSLVNYPWQASEWCQRKNKENTVKLQIYADSHLLKDMPENLRKDRVISFSQKDRKFSFRYEANTYVDIENTSVSETSHDIFTYLGE